jgi:phosphotransferase system HPr-like phosphotransfer protein
MPKKRKDNRLADRDFVLLVAVILVLVAIVLVCCKQSVPAALLVVFVMALLALSVDRNDKIQIISEPIAAARVSNNTALKARPATTFVQSCPTYIPTVPNAVNHVAVEGQGLPPGLTMYPSYNIQNTLPAGTQSQIRNVEQVVPVENVTVTNVPVKQNDPPQAPKVCSVNSAYDQYNPPAMNAPQANTYQDLYVLPTDVSRPEGQSIAQVQAKTLSKCIKKEVGAFPKPDRMKGNDVFMGEDTVVEIELEKLKGQQATNSLPRPHQQPTGSSTMYAALEVSPPALPEYHYVKPLPDFNKEMKQKIRNEGLYGIHGDLNCASMRRGAVADKGFVQPVNARQEWLRYLAYDMPNYRNQWQTARANTVNSDTRYFK